MDYALPKMNISYSGLNSSINKDVVVYENQYGLSGDDQRNYNTGQAPNSISISTETWKLDREILPNLNLDMGYSFSKSINGDTSKIYQFRERYAYTENVMNKSLFSLQDFTVNDTAGTWFENYNYYERATTEKERSFNANLAYDFTLNSQLSGKLKWDLNSATKAEHSIMTLNIPPLLMSLFKTNVTRPTNTLSGLMVSVHWKLFIQLIDLLWIRSIAMRVF